MLQLDYKKPQPIQLGKVLSSYISNVLKLDVTQFTESLTRLDALRQDVCVATNISTPTSETLHQMALYYGQIQRLAGRFPFGGESGIKVAFSWGNFSDRENRHSSNATFSCIFNAF